MVKILKTCLLASAVMLNGNFVKVTDVYLPGSHTSAYFSDKQYYEKSYGGIEKTHNNYKELVRNNF